MSGWRARAVALLHLTPGAASPVHADANSADGAESPAVHPGREAIDTTGTNGSGVELAAAPIDPKPSEAEEWAAIRAEPELPPLGTPERARLDARQHRAVNGLLAAAVKRPTALANPTALPSPGCCCGCCGGRHWWREAVAPTGWRYATCHPGDHLPDTARVEMRT